MGGPHKPEAHGRRLLTSRTLWCPLRRRCSGRAGSPATSVATPNVNAEIIGRPDGVLCAARQQRHASHTCDNRPASSVLILPEKPSALEKNRNFVHRQGNCDLDNLGEHAFELDVCGDLRKLSHRANPLTLPARHRHRRKLDGSRTKTGRKSDENWTKTGRNWTKFGRNLEENWTKIGRTKCATCHHEAKTIHAQGHNPTLE